MHLASPKPMRELVQAGGAYVRRRFEMGGRLRMAGETLTADQIASIPIRNLQALINTGMIELWPAPPASATAPAGAERFLIHLGAGRYHVVAGVRLTEETVSREEGEALLQAPGQSQH